MLSFLTASGLRDLSFRTRLGWRPHTINTDSLASLHSTQLARLTLTLFFPRSTKCNRDAVSSLIVGGARIQADKSNCCRNLIATFLILDSCALQTCDLESLSSILRTISSSWAPRRVDT